MIFSYWLKRRLRKLVYRSSWIVLCRDFHFWRSKRRRRSRKGSARSRTRHVNSTSTAGKRIWRRTRKYSNLYRLRGQPAACLKTCLASCPPRTRFPQLPLRRNFSTKSGDLPFINYSMPVASKTRGRIFHRCWLRVNTRRSSVICSKKKD